MSEVFDTDVLDAINRALSAENVVTREGDEPVYCNVNNETREIEIPGEITIFGVEHDENAVRVFFKCPKIIGDNVDIDITKSMVYIIYVNAGGEKDQYIVTDVNETEDSYVTFSWLINRKPAKYQGITQFGIRVIKSKTGGEIENEWNTTVANANILNGVETEDIELSGDNIDVVNQLLDLTKQEIELTKQNSIEEIEQKGQETLETIPSDYTTVAQNALSAKNEVEDIRVGFNGLTYKSAGQSVRGQSEQSYNIVKSISDAYKKDVNASVEIQNGYFDETGVFYQNASYKGAKILTHNKLYRVKSYVKYENSIYVIGFFDSENTLIASFKPAVREKTFDIEFTVPSEATYCIVQGYVDDDNSFTIDLIEYKDFIERYLVEPVLDSYFDFVVQEIETKKGYIGSDGTFVSNTGWSSSWINVEQGEQYKITCFLPGVSRFSCAFFFNDEKQYVSETGAIAEDTTFTDELIIVPKNAKYMVINTNTNHSDIGLHVKKREPIIIKIKADTELIEAPLKNMNVIFLGDSITAQEPTSWRDTFLLRTGATQVLCTAVAGAHLCDYSDTILDGVNFEGHNNTISNQVQRIINTPPDVNIDFIMICAGTNDTTNTLEELDGSVTQFIDKNNEYIDVDTIDRKRFDGAMRWSAEKLWNLFPNATIFFASPIHGAQAIRASWRQIRVNNYMTKVCEFLATPIIPATVNSGIYGRYEKANGNGKYLVDGLHPNSDGKKKLGDYYASCVINYFTNCGFNN